MKPFLKGLSPTLHISHRGGAGLAPENTLVAFRAAVERHRTDMLELDVQVTRDGVLVVAHDDDVGRCTDGAGELRALTFVELEELDAGYRFSRDGHDFPFRGQGVRIPRFEALLRAFPGVRLNVELKPSSAGAAEALVSLLVREGAVDRVCLGSEDDALGERLHALLPGACHFYPREALKRVVMAAKLGTALPTDERFSVLDMPLAFEGMRLVDRPFLSAMKDAGKWVNVWTIDDPEEMRRLRDDGVGGIMTDRPELLREVLGGA